MPLACSSALALARVRGARVGALLLELAVLLVDPDGDRLRILLRDRPHLLDGLHLRGSLRLRHGSTSALAGPAVALFHNIDPLHVHLRAVPACCTPQAVR